jgi:hypothetical protein
VKGREEAARLERRPIGRGAARLFQASVAEGLHGRVRELESCPVALRR